MERRIRTASKVLIVTVAAWILCATLGSPFGSNFVAAAGTDAPAAARGPVGPISAPGGPFLRDADGRVVLLHGVNLMYKRAPYEIVTSGKGINVLTNAQAASMATDGFDVVRLGIFWKGLEPGTAPMNDPAICTPGSPNPAGPGQFSAKVFDNYMAKLERTIGLLARHGIYSLVDMHQDAMNEVFAGEGFPDWAVCTDGITPKAYRNVAAWGINQLDAGMAQATGHFWQNDVVGNLQGAYDQIWAKVAARLATNPWVIGYDLFNEPFEPSILLGSNVAFDTEVQCFYAGRSHPGNTQIFGLPIKHCPPDDPSSGLISAIEHVDHDHTIFFEPDTTTSGTTANFIGSMNFPRLVYNFHNYCPLHVPNGPEPSNYASACPSPEEAVFTVSAQDRINDRSKVEPNGPGWFLSEFGATTDASDIGRIVSDADADLVGWMYWQWLRYDDPTGSHDSGLWPAGPATADQLDVLAETYAQAIAGTPTSMSFDATTATFHLTYRPERAISAPTVVFIPLSRHYRHGYCAQVSGGKVTSPSGASRLTVENSPSASEVHVSVIAGTCRSSRR